MSAGAHSVPAWSPSTCELCGQRFPYRALDRWERLIRPAPVLPLSFPPPVLALRETIVACTPCGKTWRREKRAGTS